MQPGEIVADRFEIERPIGAGGMGVVYRARDRDSNALVAVKLMLGADAASRQRFDRESRLVAELAHPRIVRHVAHGTTERGEPFLVMEWLDGEPLDARLARGPLAIAESFAVARACGAALAAAHAAGIVHRDVKPANIFLVGGRAEDAKLLDFGIAREVDAATSVTKTGVRVGTVGYMSPEAARGARVEPSADVFAVGCVLYECLTGTPAFSGVHVVAVLARILLEDPPPVSHARADTPPEVDALVARLLAKDASQRPADGFALLAALEDTGGPSPIASAPPPPVTQTEQRFVTVVLVAPAKDDATAVTEVAPAHHTSDGTLAERHGGRLVTLVDGSTLLVFEGAGVATDTARRAVRCALELAGGRRIAVATGRSVGASSLPIGEPIERAVALNAERGPSGVRLDDVTRALVGGRFEMDASSATVVRETVPRQREYRLLGKPTECFGREKELSLLLATFDECVEESVARAVIVTAPPGTGKSRLAHELVARLRQRGHGRVLYAHADPFAAGSALVLVRQLILDAMGRESVTFAEIERDLQARGVYQQQRAEFLGELLGAPSPEKPSVALKLAREDARAMTENIRRAFEEWLEMEVAQSPIVVVLEDLHWSDVASIGHVEGALRRLAARPIFVIGLARPDAHETFPKLWETIHAQTMRLAPLLSRAAERLVRQALGEDVDAKTLQRVVELSEGNPFFLEECVRRIADGADDLPASVLAMVASRLERLAPEARRVLRAASVFGETFWLGGAAALLGGTDGVDAAGWLRELEAKELVVAIDPIRFPNERAWVFRHGLVREAAYAMLPLEQRKIAHRQAADWLESAGERDPLVMAEHLDRAGDAERAVPWFLRAARAALEGGDLDAAVSLVVRGERAGAAGELLGRLHGVAALAFAWRGIWPQAIQHGMKALALVPRTEGEWFLASAAVLYGCAASGDVIAATATMAMTLATPTPTPASGGYAFAMYAIYNALIQVGESALADEVERRLIADVERERDPIVEAWRYLASWSKRPDALIDVAQIDRVVEKLGECGDVVGVSMALATVTWWSCETGDLVGARSRGARSLAAAARCGLDVMVDWTSFALVVAELYAGSPAEARERLPKAIAAEPMRAVFHRALLAEIAYHEGALDEADVIATRVCTEGEMFIMSLALACVVRARIALQRGRPLEAVALAERAIATRQSILSVVADARNVRAEALEAAGRHDEARAALREARDRLTRMAANAPSPEQFLYGVPSNRRTMELARAWLS